MNAAGHLMKRITEGRTDLVFDWIASGGDAGAVDESGVSLMQWCAYYGDVGSLRYLQTRGASLELLGKNLDLNGAAFHGHWQLCQFLLENGADANYPLSETGEAPLHSASSKADSLAHHLVVRVLLAAGADPHAVTLANAPTDAFMRDTRTRAETPLHRAAAFGLEETIDLLLAAGARREAMDLNGDTPLSWASWHGRPASVLRKLCYGEFLIRPDYAGMAANLLGRP